MYTKIVVFSLDFHASSSGEHKKKLNSYYLVTTPKKNCIFLMNA